ncbi:hypothetical protein M422DRAFT_249932 [Sphaerobolus stellatus SS14]|nr:hypothetical protein M422DRAFT_249932 [Sphaerobolus stellatus SS14]
MALGQMFDGLAIILGGILRATARQFTGALLNISTYYAIGIPLGIYLAFSKDMGLVGLWTGIATALICGGLASIFIYLRMDWDKAVVDAHALHEKERQLEAVAIENNP